MNIEILEVEEEGINYKYVPIQDLKDAGYLITSYDNYKLKEFAGTENTVVTYSLKRDRKVVGVNIIGIQNIYNVLNYPGSKDVLYDIKKVIGGDVVELDRFREDALIKLLNTIMQGGECAVGAALELHRLLN